MRKFQGTAISLSTILEIGRSMNRLQNCLMRFQSLHNRTVPYPNIGVAHMYHEMMCIDYTKTQALWKLKLMIRSGYDSDFMEMVALGEVHIKKVKQPHYSDLESDYRKKRRF